MKKWIAAFMTTALCLQGALLVAQESGAEDSRDSAWYVWLGMGLVALFVGSLIVRRWLSIYRQWAAEPESPPANGDEPPH